MARQSIARSNRDLDERVRELARRIGRENPVTVRRVDPATLHPERRLVGLAPRERPDVTGEVRTCARDGCELTFDVPTSAPDKRFCSTRCRERDAAKRQGRGFKPKRCAWCGQDFMPTAPRQVYCCAEHRDEADRDKKRAHARRQRAQTVEADRVERNRSSHFDRYFDVLLMHAGRRDLDGAALLGVLDRLERLVVARTQHEGDAHETAGSHAVRAGAVGAGEG
jgi:hypothetical protein